MQTDRQTDTQSDRSTYHNTPPPSRGGVIIHYYSTACVQGSAFNLWQIVCFYGMRIEYKRLFSIQKRVNFQQMVGHSAPYLLLHITRYFFLAVAETVSSTYCAYPRRMVRLK